ncbi:MAG: hypothetical protein ACO3GN_05820 [Bacteroidia bacterium]
MARVVLAGCNPAEPVSTSRRRAKIILDFSPTIQAAKTRELLIQNGVPATQITAVGRGAITDTRQTSSAVLQQNRRVDLECIPQ